MGRAKISRILVALLLCGLAGGCASLVSEHPVFAPADFDGSAGLLGVYSEPNGGKDRATYYVERSGAAGMRIFGLKDDDHGVSQQIFYGEGGAIALAGADHVLQFSCVAYLGAKGWNSADIGKPNTRERKDTFYGLAIKDRRADNFWVLESAQGIGDNDSALFRKFGVVQRRLIAGEHTDKDTIDVLPRGMSTDTAREFFRALADSVMNGAASPVLLERSAGALTAEQAKALTLTTPEACRAIAEHGARFDE